MGIAVVATYETKQGKRYRVRYRTPDNRQTDKRGFRTKREAERFANTVEVAKLRGEYVNPADARKTLDDLGRDWLARQKGHLKPSGYSVMETTWRVRVQRRWGHVALGDIKPSAVQKWMAELGQGTEDTKAIGAAAIKRAHHVLSRILADAVRDNLIPKNPAAGLTLPRTKRKTPVYLNHQQVAALADAAEECGTLVLVLAYTGLRWGETIGLRVGDLDLLRKRALIHENAVQSGKGIHVGTPKATSSVRCNRLSSWYRCWHASARAGTRRPDVRQRPALAPTAPSIRMVRKSGRRVQGAPGDSARLATHCRVAGRQCWGQREGGPAHARARQRRNDIGPLRRPV